MSLEGIHKKGLWKGVFPWECRRGVVGCSLFLVMLILSSAILFLLIINLVGLLFFFFL